MLILTRRPGEAVLIGRDITVRVLGVHGRQVRIGFTAPADMTMNREEVEERIQAEQAEVMRWSGREGNPPTPSDGTLHLKIPRHRRRSNTVDGNR